MCNRAGLTIRSQHWGQCSQLLTALPATVGKNNFVIPQIVFHLFYRSPPTPSVFSPLYHEVPCPRTDSAVWLLHWSGCPALKEDLSHYKQKWRGQSKCCSCLRTRCQCQTACCLDTQHRGMVEMYQKALLYCHIATERHFTISLRVRLCFTNDHFFFFFGRLLHLKWRGSKKKQKERKN